MSEGRDIVLRLVTWTWTDADDVSALWRIVHDRNVDAVAVVAAAVDVGDMLRELADLLEQPLAASVSPLPLGDWAIDRLERYELSEALPPPPTLALPSSTCAVFACDALRVAWPTEPTTAVPWPDLMSSIATRLVDRGWRHVGAPGIGLQWAAGTLREDSRGGWSASGIAEIDGLASEALSTHQLWATTRRHIDVVIDAACLDGDPHNGSQALVLNVARSLASARPTASVKVAVEKEHVDEVDALLGGELAVIERGASVVADVIYRPYQLLVPAELPWLTHVGRRLLVGQLDMIGFSNPSYHPSPALFHMVRNLQRLTMRVADGVTFISEFGRRHALIECPDLEANRCFMVSSGAATPDQQVSSQPVEGPPYVLCLSAFFWHKNREHAIRTFAAMVTQHGYDGELRIAGPEPIYGRSTDAEAELLRTMPAEVQSRVRSLGRVDASTKWTLLQHADLLIYPSVVEGFGMVPFEAAAVGTPSVVAPGSALAEVFDGTGAVVGSWDESVWAARASELVNDSQTAAQVVDAILERAQLHSWSSVADATWSAIDAVVARPRARLHHDEGGVRSRIASREESSAGASSIHFANRLEAYARRRLGRPRNRR